MKVQITIRDVPDAVRDELAARTAIQGKSMQEYLRAELERLAARFPVEKVLEQILEEVPRYTHIHTYVKQRYVWC